MKYGRIYRMEWDTTDVVKSLVSINVVAKVIRVNIYDTEILIDDDADETIINLQAAGEPLTISVINNDDNKMAVVRAKQAIIRFLTDRAAGLDVSLFAEASDNQFKVEILADNLTLFLGFLMISDIEQRFLPDPQVVEITATDHLGILKEIPLTADDGSLLVGKYKIAHLLATALKKTGLELDINVVNNVRHGSGTVTVDLISFVADGDLLFVSNAWYNYFYPGQRITVSSSIANNITLTVLAVTPSFFTIISVQEALTNEALTANVVLSDNSSGHLYDSMLIDSVTFETNANGEKENCRTVIEKILGFDCFITQWKGAWWIIRVGEINAGVLYPARFDPDGGFDDYIDPVALQRNIGNTETVGHANASTNISFDRPHKFVKLSFRYSTPKEIICNIDFSRGDVISAPNPSLGVSYGTYQLDCWTMRRRVGSITSTKLVKRRFEYGYPKDKYVVISPSTGVATPWDFAESQPMEVRAKDKLAVSVDWRFDTDFNIGLVTYFPLMIYLKGDDGHYYYYWHPSSSDLEDYYWTDAGTSELDRYIGEDIASNSEDMTQWRSMSLDLKAVPVDGKLYICLIQGHQGNSPPADNQNINFQNLRVDLIYFINGSYQTYTGQSNSVTRAGGGAGYNAMQDEEVYISDSPRPNFKGAMFWLSSGGNYKLSSRFHEAHLYALGSPAMDGYNLFGYFQVFAFWNQNRNANRRFQSSLYGIFAGTTPENWPDLVFKFALTDADNETNDRFFMLLSFGMDFKNAQWNGLLIECFNVLIGHVKTDTHDFKYLTE